MYVLPSVPDGEEPIKNRRLPKRKAADPQGHATPTECKSNFRLFEKGWSISSRTIKIMGSTSARIAKSPKRDNSANSARRRKTDTANAAPARIAITEEVKVQAEKAVLHGVV